MLGIIILTSYMKFIHTSIASSFRPSLVHSELSLNKLNHLEQLV